MPTNANRRSPASSSIRPSSAKVRGLYGDKFVMQSGWCARLVANGSIVGWHQDGSGAYGFEKVGYPVPLLQLRASFNLTDQSQEYMGNMMLIPGSHRSPFPPAGGQAQRSHGLAHPAQRALQARHDAAVSQWRVALAHAQR